ncbi:MAG: DUF1592 domain-containing protein [Myxococcota bacterium]
MIDRCATRHRGSWIAGLALSMACQGVIGSAGGEPGEPCSPGPGETPIPGGVEAFVCDEDATGSISPSYVLTRPQLSNTLEDLFGASALASAEVGLSRLATEVYDEVTHQRTSTLESAKVSAYHDIARAVAAHVAADDSLLETVFGACALDGAPDCIDTFIDGFGPRILRRPLTSSETAFVTMLAERPAPFRDNAEAVLAYVLQSPFFLWRVELGEPGGEATSEFSITPYEVATRIAYDLTNSTPDAELLASAAEGRLSTRAEVEAQVRRLLQTPRGRRKVVDNIAHWSMSEIAADLSTLPEALTEGVETEGLSDAMLEEARQFIDSIVFEQDGTFGDLLRSTDSFAEHPGLATIYGHEPASGEPAAMGDGRSGILMRAAPLTWTGARTSIIHRGVDFQLRILCNQIPEPTVDIAEAREDNALPEDEAEVTANRDVIAHLTRSPGCMTCHSTINPTGFAFEGFDSLGRVRSEEILFDREGNVIGTAPIDTRTAVPLPDGSELEVSGAPELIDYVATSPEGNACFALSIFRYVSERLETPGDGCRIQTIHSTLMSPDQTLLDALVALLAHESVFQKTVE